jgi:hypothetical protein
MVIITLIVGGFFGWLVGVAVVRIERWWQNR